MQLASQGTILIVNDSEDQIERMRTLLNQTGYRVVTARDGHQGLEAARHERPLLIISAMLIPGGGDTELCRLIRVDSELHLTPILLVSEIRKDAASIIDGLEAGRMTTSKLPTSRPIS